MATKTVAIPDDVHQLISEAQLDIRKECGINLNISYIVAQVLKTYTKEFTKKMKEGIKSGVRNVTGQDDISEEKVKEDDLKVGKIQGNLATTIVE